MPLDIVLPMESSIPSMIPRMFDDTHVTAIERACRLLETSDPAPSLAHLARECRISPWHFQRLFKSIIGLSQKRYALAQRDRRLAESLRLSGSVTEAIYDAGYASSSSAYRDSARLGMVPGRIRRGGMEERIRHATASTGLGTVLVAATDRGVCLVEFLAAGAAPTRLAEAFPRARIE